MKLGYTEFSYGYAFTENLIRSAAARPAGAPVFPNLVQEAKLGYDVNIDLPGCPLFFQYKLPELMKKNNAVEVSQHQLGGIFAPFFRMPLMRRDLSDQHRLLIACERKFPRSVYYASPSMNDIGSFNSAYNLAQVHEKSVFFSPQEIGPLPDDKPHVIAYKRGLSHAWLCSQPRTVGLLSFRDVEKRVKTELDSLRFSSLGKASQEIQNEIVQMSPRELQVNIDEIRRRTVTRVAPTLDRADIDDRKRKVLQELLVSREVARVGIGLDMVIAQPDV